MFETPNRSTPRPDAASDERRFKARLEAGYAEDGITPEKVRETLAAIRDVQTKRAFDGGTHETAFYLNSSDPLEILYKDIDVRDRRVATVAGSGDFAQIFLAAGAKEVTIFDISLPAALFSELKMVALQRLDLRGYRAMFETWKTLDADAPWFDETSYRTIRDGLSAEACAYFDALLRPENRDLYRLDADDDEILADGFARTRVVRERKPYPERDILNYPSFIGDVIASEEAYAQLQGQAKHADVSIRLKDVQGAAGGSMSAETVYLSNIGYWPQASIAIAQRFFEAGATQAYFTTQRYFLQTLEAPDLPSRLDPGAVFTYEGKTVRVIGHDDNVGYGLLVEVRP